MNKEAMFEEISRIMQEDMAPTMGCTGPISYIFSAAAARELAGGTEVRRVRCQASGKFCARMGEVVTPGLPEADAMMADLRVLGNECAVRALEFPPPLEDDRSSTAARLKNA